MQPQPIKHDIFGPGDYDPSKGAPVQSGNNGRFQNLADERYKKQGAIYQDYQQQQANRIAAERQAVMAESQRQAEALQQQRQAAAAQQEQAARELESQRNAEQQRLAQAAREQEAAYEQQRQAQAQAIAEQQAAQAAELAKQELNTNAASQSIRILGAKGVQAKAPAAAVTRGKKPLGVGGAATVSPTQSLRIGSTARTAGVGTNLGV